MSTFCDINADGFPTFERGGVKSTEYYDPVNTTTIANRDGTAIWREVVMFGDKRKRLREISLCEMVVVGDDTGGQSHACESGCWSGCWRRASEESEDAGVEEWEGGVLWTG